MIKIDSLAEITATFYYPGDRAKSSAIEEHAWTDLEANSDLLAMEFLRAEEVAKDSQAAWAEAEDGLEMDLLVTAPCIGFDVSHISEGRCDHPYSSGMDFEISEGSGYDWLDEPYFKEEAEKVRAELIAAHERKSLKGFGLVEATPYALPVRRLSWIEAFGYYSYRDGYTGEYDAGVERHGRVHLQDIAEAICKRDQAEAAAALQELK